MHQLQCGFPTLQNLLFCDRQKVQLCWENSTVTATANKPAPFMRFIRQTTFTFSVMWEHIACSQCVVVVLTWEQEPLGSFASWHMQTQQRDRYLWIIPVAQCSVLFWIFYFKCIQLLVWWMSRAKYRHLSNFGTGSKIWFIKKKRERKRTQ